MPSWIITARRNMGKIKKGHTLNVVSQYEKLTSQEIKEALVISGYDEKDFEGHLNDGWDYEEVNKGKRNKGGDKSYNAQHKNYENKLKEGKKRSKDNSFFVKMFFTIFPLLPMWWLFKLPFAVLVYPFRKKLLPSYSFKKF